jgi:hypothetical protein
MFGCDEDNPVTSDRRMELSWASNPTCWYTDDNERCNEELDSYNSYFKYENIYLIDYDIYDGNNYTDYIIEVCNCISVDGNEECDEYEGSCHIVSSIHYIKYD